MTRVVIFFAMGLSLLQAQGGNIIPQGTVLEIRLKKAVSSYTTKAGTEIWAEVIAPVEVGGKTVLPMGAELLGYVKDARKVGLGFSRETALLHLEFDRLQVPGGGEQKLAGRVAKLDDAREQVDAEGRIRGIRATESFSSMLAGFAVSAASFDPMALIFAMSSSLSVFRLPDASVVLPAGTELRFTVAAELAVPGVIARQYPEFAATDGEMSELESLVKGLPFRTETEGDGMPSDLTSLLYLGSGEAIERAFDAAGWVRSDRLDGKSTYGVMRSIIENQGYRAAPMSVLTLGGKRPEFAFAKTLNTFFSRHHLRIYAQEGQFGGQGVWTSTATYDKGIGFSRAAKTFVHVINENIDEERRKVVNDLVLTGCVAGVTYLERPWVPLDAKNATGDTLRTDGRIAVLRMNDCTKAKRADEEDAEKDAAKLRQSSYARPVRSAVLTARNDLLRGNLVYQAYHGVRLARDFLRKPDTSSGEPKRFRYGGQEFLIVEGAKPMKRADLPEDSGRKLQLEKKATGPKSYVHKISFSLSAGLNGFGNSAFTTQNFNLTVGTPPGPVVRDSLQFHSSLERGWTIAPRLTLNSWKYVSNEFGYSRVSTNFRLFGGDSLTGTQLDSRSKAAIRMFTYNLIVNATPNGRRVRPYFAVGPSFQLIHLMDAAPVRNSILNLVSRDVALLIGAYDFGSKPPLQGGGMFQFGLNYGGGVRVFLTPRVFLRGDFRETISRQPDFWKGSRDELARQVNTDSLRLDDVGYAKHAPLRHQQVTLGIGLAF
jgi:hypothetical protein